MQSKFIRTLIIINGIIIPIFALAVVYKLAEDYFRYTDFSPEGVLVGEKLKGALVKDAALQGLQYEAPFSIYNSTNLYMPLSVMSYEEAKILKEEMEMSAVPSSGDVSFGHNEMIPRDIAY